MVPDIPEGDLADHILRGQAFFGPASSNRQLFYSAIRTILTISQLRDVLDGLVFLHGESITHGNLKPVSSPFKLHSDPLTSESIGQRAYLFREWQLARPYRKLVFAQLLRRQVPCSRTCT